MATNVYGVKRVFTRRRLRRRFRQMAKYTGQKGWNWVELEVSNAFTNVDNVVANIGLIGSGLDFEPLASAPAVGNANNRLIVYRSMRIQGQVSILTSDPEAYPYVAYDVGIVKFDDGQDISTPNAATARLRSLCIATNNRVVWHTRIWAARQAALADSESTDSAYGTGVMSSLIDVTIKPNIPLAERESIALVLSQVDSELYTEGHDSLFTGYVKSWVQLK